MRDTIRQYPHNLVLADPLQNTEYLLDVNYPDRSATTILAGGSGG
jgi:hypothetical protein